MRLRVFQPFSLRISLRKAMMAVVVLLAGYGCGSTPCLAKPQGASQLAEQIRVRDCTAVSGEVSVDWIRHDGRYSYGRIRQKKLQYVVIDRLQDAVHSCHVFSTPQPVAATNTAILQGDGCHKESCPTLVVKGDKMLLLASHCSGGVPASFFSTKEHGEWLHVICRQEIGLGYRQLESLVQLTAKPKEYLITVAGEVAILTPDEVKNLGCQPGVAGGITVKPANRKLLVEAVALRQQLDEHTVVTRTIRWQWSQSGFRELDSPKDASVSVCSTP